MLPEEAQRKILERAKPGESEPVPLDAARRRVLSAPVVAPMPLPPFAQSAMDGYAVAAPPGGAPRGSRYELRGESRAGGEEPLPLREGQATRIFTGAPVPRGATLVAMQEVVSVTDGVVLLHETVDEERFIRPAGSDVAAGAEALPKGTVLGPAALAFLRGLAVTHVIAHRAPRVGLVASGDELCLDPAQLGPRQVMESSSAALASALTEEGLRLSAAHLARDTQKAHREALQLALEKVDVLMVTGGVSVGDYDFVRPALAELGVEQVFWTVRQRPGGPFYFGLRGGQLVFGIPGNPASTLVCFYEHVLPALRRMLGWPSPCLPRVRATLSEEFRKPAGKTWFARAHVAIGADEGLIVRTALQQDSHTLRSFARANALAVFPADQERFAAGSQVECDLLPGMPLDTVEEAEEEAP